MALDLPWAFNQNATLASQATHLAQIRSIFLLVKDFLITTLGGTVAASSSYDAYSASSDVIGSTPANLVFARSTANTASFTIANPCVMTVSSLSGATVNGDVVYFTTTGALPAGLAVNTPYFLGNIINSNANLFDTYANAIANTSTGRVITTGTQSGSHSVYGGGSYVTVSTQVGCAPGIAGDWAGVQSKLHFTLALEVASALNGAKSGLDNSSSTNLITLRITAHRELPTGGVIGIPPTSPTSNTKLQQIVDSALKTYTVHLAGISSGHGVGHWECFLSNNSVTAMTTGFGMIAPNNVNAGSLPYAFPSGLFGFFHASGTSSIAFLSALNLLGAWNDSGTINTTGVYPFFLYNPAVTGNKTIGTGTIGGNGIFATQDGTSIEFQNITSGQNARMCRWADHYFSGGTTANFTTNKASPDIELNSLVFSDGTLWIPTGNTTTIVP